MAGCLMYNHLTTAVRILELHPLLGKYCLSSEGHQECARYKIKAQGNEPSEKLLPDGAFLKS